MTAERDAILRSRLFGYAVLFRARQTEAGFKALATSPEAEAGALARELQLHAGQSVDVPSGALAEGEVGLSVPFGRCGIRGRPLEHVRIFHAEEAWVDRLSPQGATSTAVAEGETLLVEPGGFVRFRARPHPGRRVLISFQTEDRSPLAGHATALIAAGESVPTEAGARLERTTAAFESLQLDPGTASGRISELLAEMYQVVSQSPEVSAAQNNAAASGSYSAGSSAELFDAARNMLTPGVIERIGQADAQIFRFPGMFGAVAPLFPLLDS